MPLDPKAKALLDAQKALGAPPLCTLPVSVVRQAFLARIKARRTPDFPVASAEDRVIPGPLGDIPVRVYTPAGTGPFPVLVFFHGGGFVVCNLDTHDPICRALCAGAGCVVVSVDYRLAPEHKFPMPLEDCVAAMRWVAANAAGLKGDPRRLAVGGDSAGGNLAAVTALRARDEGGPSLRGQLLLYPVTDHYDPGTPSYVENGKDYGLTREDMIWFWDHYLGDKAEAGNPHASPLRAPDLRGLPPALLITAEYDPLRDEGERYAERLRAAGVDCTLTRYDGMFHGFAGQFGFVDQAQQVMDEASAWLRQLFGR
jgi:acetyl esterase